jgi:hypothetical protein
MQWGGGACIAGTKPIHFGHISPMKIIVLRMSLCHNISMTTACLYALTKLTDFKGNSTEIGLFTQFFYQTADLSNILLVFLNAV